MLDLARINNMAAESDFTNFDGEGGPRYTGYGDDFLDFDGKNLDFASSMNTGREYQITVANATGVAKTLVLCPSYAPGALAANEHIIAEGAIVASFTAAGAPSSITEFLAWINIVPTMVNTLRVQSTLSSQLQQQIVIQRKSIFKTLETERINIGSSVSEISPNDKLVTVNRPFQLDNQSKISVIIPDTATTVFTFYCGAVLNPAAALHTKFKKAKQTAIAAANGR